MERNRNVSELAHHGIKGQRWGRRRYQNQDGSLTPAGRKRYESFSSAEKVAYLRRQGYDMPRSKGHTVLPNATSTIDNNTNNSNQTNANNSPNVKSATFNRPNTNTNNSNSNQTNANNSNKPNTNNSNQTNANNGKKRWQDMDTKEYLEKNAYKKAQNEYKQLYGIKSQGEIRKDISDQANKAVSSVKDIGNSINKIRSIDKPGPDYSHLSNAELQERINRINLEQRYADLTRPRESSKAVKFKETMNVIGGVVAFTGSVIGVANAIKDLRSSS